MEVCTKLSIIRSVIKLSAKISRLLIQVKDMETKHEHI